MKDSLIDFIIALCDGFVNCAALTIVYAALWCIFGSTP